MLVPSAKCRIGVCFSALVKIMQSSWFEVRKIIQETTGDACLYATGDITELAEKMCKQGK